MNKRFITLGVILSLTMMILADNIHIYVSPNGKDTNDGTKANPVATFTKAQELAQKTSNSSDVVVTFEDGNYYLSDSILFTTSDNKHSVLYEAENEGKAIISGGQKLNLTWYPYKDGIYVADVNGDYTIDQLYVNGKRQRMARFPNAQDGYNVYDAWNLDNATYSSSKDALLKSRTSTWANPEGGYIHAMHNLLWGDMHWIITGKNTDGSLEYVGGWQNNRQADMHGTYRFVENIFEELDVAGEWYYNSSEHKLYYMPDTSTDINSATIEIVRLQNLITFKGSKEAPVKNIHLSGFVFRHAARTFMQNKEPLLRSDWTICRIGAISYYGAEDCEIRDCEFDQVGGNTIVVSNYNRGIAVRGCYIHDSGASGVVFVGNPDCVRNAMTAMQAQNYSALSYEKGPKFVDYPDSCIVEDCIISHTGRDEKQTTGVEISMSHGIHVSHCSIYDVPRAGINISEGTFGGHLIENCDIFNTVLETGDHGSFNSWGRDRYWSPDANLPIPYVNAHPELPFLDMLDSIEIRNNRWRCDHGWDIDLDDGSTWYVIHNNLCLNGGIKLREGYHRRVYNNIMINNSLNPHVWYSNCEDQFYSNIVTTAYKPAAMTTTMSSDAKWGKLVDYNLFAANDNERKAYTQNGCDTHSISAYPEFIDSVNGDFRVKDTSPAISMGFVNFPMDQFGVVKASLKAIAKTPEMPTFNVDITTPTQTEKAKYYFYDVLLEEPKAQELSAYGVGLDEGGVAMSSVTTNSKAEKVGFKSRDLIQAINGSSISNITDLQTFLYSNDLTKGVYVVSIVRNQERITITLEAPISNLTVIMPEYSFNIYDNEGAIDKSLTQNITYKYLHESRNFSRSDDKNVESSRFGLLGEPWVVSDNLINQDNFTHGGYDNLNYSGKYISIEKWGTGLPAIKNGYIYQTTKDVLPAGKYHLNVKVNSQYNFNSKECLLNVVQGTDFVGGIPITSYDMSSRSGYGYTCDNICEFTLKEPSVISLGWLVNLTAEQYEHSIRIEDIRLIDDNDNDLSATLLGNYTNIQRADGSYNRYGTPTYWSQENFSWNSPGWSGWGSKGGIDKNAGYPCLALSVWDDSWCAPSNADVSKTKLYQTVTLPKGKYYFGGSYFYQYQSNNSYLFVALHAPAASETKTKAIAYRAIKDIPSNLEQGTNKDWYGVTFTLEEPTTVDLGWNADLSSPTQQEFLVEEIGLLRYLDEPDNWNSDEAITVDDSLYIPSSAFAEELNADNSVSATNLPILSCPDYSKVIIGQVNMDEVTNISVYSNSNDSLPEYASYKILLDDSNTELTAIPATHKGNSKCDITTSPSFTPVSGIHTIKLQVIGASTPVNIWGLSFRKAAKVNIDEDINKDGNVDSQDVLKVYEYMKTSTESPTSSTREDVNKDGEADSQDILKIYEYMKAH